MDIWVSERVVLLETAGERVEEGGRWEISVGVYI